MRKPARPPCRTKIRALRFAAYLAIDSMRREQIRALRFAAYPATDSMRREQI